MQTLALSCTLVDFREIPSVTVPTRGSRSPLVSYIQREHLFRTSSGEFEDALIYGQGLRAVLQSLMADMFDACLDLEDQHISSGRAEGVRCVEILDHS